jgi:hypothetical protein
MAQFQTELDVVFISIFVIISHFSKCKSDIFVRQFHCSPLTAQQNSEKQIREQARLSIQDIPCLLEHRKKKP